MTFAPLAAARAAARYPAHASSARSARGLVAAALAQWGAEALTDDATLLVSELVTNAIVHAGTDVELSVALQADAVEVSVTDRHPARTVPAPPAEVDTEREGGRGVALLAAIAPGWGVDYTDRTKRVWFRLPLPAGAVPAPRGDLEQLATPADGPDDEPAPEVVATVRLDADAVVVEADPNAESMLGWAADELVGRPWQTVVAPEDAGTLVAAQSASRWQGTYRVVAADARVRQVMARHVRLAPAGGARPETLCVLVDHRLRALVGDLARAPGTPLVHAGPFAMSPEQLVRLELDELLERTAAWAREAFAADAAYALLVTDDEDELELRACSGDRPPDGRRRLPDAPTLPTVHDDLAARPDHDGWLVPTGARSSVTVPLLAAGRLVGTVVLSARRPSAFGVGDATRLQHAADTVALAVANARFAEIERRRHGWLGYLAEAGELLAGTLELDMALALLAQLVSPRLGPWCAVLLADESGDGGTRPAIVWHSDEDRIEDLRRLLAASPVPPAEAGTPARWLPLAADDAVPPGTEDLAAAGGHVVALVARGRVLGGLLVGIDRAGGAVRRHLHLLADLAPRAALALDNARLYAERASTTRALQRSLLPPELPDLAGVDVGVVYEATGESNEVGGDFYDIFRTPGRPGPDGERFGFAVGDVCGKGPEAAAVTGLARTALRVLSRRGDDLPDVLADLNAAILAEGSRSRFLTAIYGEGARDGSDLVLRLASAGHPSPLVLRADGSVEKVPASGDLLGVFDAPEVTVTTVRLAPGESLVCFTDGVTERRAGGRMLGEDGVAAVVRGATGFSAAALARRLGTAVRDFATEPARDDVAILVLRAQASTTTGMIMGRRR